jgi:type IV pilus assembly protein PilO
MAKMPRIVTLNNLALTAGKDGTLSLDAIAKTFRYLDQEELDAQAKARKAKLSAKKEKA